MVIRDCTLSFIAFLTLVLGAVVLGDVALAQSLTLIEIRHSPELDDDFLCWAPVPARIKLGAPGGGDVTVTLKSRGVGPLAGEVGFMPSTNGPISRANFAPEKELTLTLKGDGSWTEFFVMGLKASSGAKDIEVRAELADGSALSQVSVMVRVRKNSETLTPKERNSFLTALAQWKLRPGLTRPTRFEDYYVAHADAFEKGIHSDFGSTSSNFLPWHRAFLLNLERELQTIDSTVTLPYWKFEAPAPQLFSADFLGARNPQSNEVDLASSNPIRGWATSNGQLLTRSKAGDLVAALPDDALSNIACSGASCPLVFRQTTDTFEMNYHNGAHSFILGWLGSGSSPRDPLFFLLHANVDRGWAHWQQINNRYDPTDQGSYTPAGTYPGTVQNGIREGLYTNDHMWPWGEKTGDWGTPDPADDWLPYRFPFPAAQGLPLSPVEFPTPATMLDYIGVRGGTGLGFCYDDIGFMGGNPDDLLAQVQ